LLACFATPFAWITGELGLSTVADEVEQQNLFSRIMTELKGRGWARSAIDHFHAWHLSAMALAAVAGSGRRQFGYCAGAQLNTISPASLHKTFAWRATEIRARDRRRRPGEWVMCALPARDGGRQHALS